MNEQIYANEIKPGMVIGIQRNNEDISLVIKATGRITVEYTHFDYNDASMGLMVGTLKGNQCVRVLKGDERLQVLSSVYKEVCDAKRTAETNIMFVKLVQEIK